MTYLLYTCSVGAGDLHILLLGLDTLWRYLRLMMAFAEAKTLMDDTQVHNVLLYHNM
jgi:hypothetical protein